MKKTKTITVFDREQYDSEWPPENAKDFIGFFAAKLDEIPEQYQDTATIELDSISGYEGCSYASIVITYRRPETDEEEITREQQERARDNAIKEREIETLKKLKDKYPGA